MTWFVQPMTARIAKVCGGLVIGDGIGIFVLL